MCSSVPVHLLRCSASARAIARRPQGRCCPCSSQRRAVSCVRPGPRRPRIKRLDLGMRRRDREVGLLSGGETEAPRAGRNGRAQRGPLALPRVQNGLDCIILATVACRQFHRQVKLARYRARRSSSRGHFGERPFRGVEGGRIMTKWSAIEGEPGSVSRRQLLKVGGGLAVSAGAVGPLLAACGNGSSRRPQLLLGGDLRPGQRVRRIQPCDSGSGRVPDDRAPRVRAARAVRPVHQYPLAVAAGGVPAEGRHQHVPGEGAARADVPRRHSGAAERRRLHDQVHEGPEERRGPGRIPGPGQ